MAKSAVRKSRSFRSDRWGWIVFLVLVFVVGPLTWAWYHRRVLKPTVAPVAATTPFRLVVLEFGRLQLTAGGENMTGAQLDGHLSMLRAKGFVPVTASQVTNAYLHGGSLPPRAVLLSFDGGYFSTYEAAHPVLAKQQCPALMFVETGRQEHRDPVFLYWDRLQLMVDSGIWEIGTHGHRPLASDGRPLPGAPSGEAGFVQSRNLIEGHVRHCKVQAFAHLAHLTTALPPSVASESRPSLAFWSDAFGANGPEESPQHLSRMKVEPSWTPEMLAQRLEWAVTAPGAEKPETQAERWIPSGSVEAIAREGNTLRFGGHKRSDAWLSGSRWVQDFSLQARIKIESGEFWFAQEAENGGRHWRLGGKPDVLYFQDRTPGAPPNTLMRFPLPERLQGWHTLTLIRRGPGLWVTLDAKPLNELPLLMPGRWSGNLGILAAPGEQGETHFEVADLRFSPIAYRVQSVAPDPSQTEIQTLGGTTSDLAAISPVWATRQQGETRMSVLNADLLHMIQRRFVLDVLLGVKVLDTPEQGKDWIVAAAQQAASAGWNGLRLDVSALPGPEQMKWQQVIHEMETQMKALNLRCEVATGGLQ